LNLSSSDWSELKQTFLKVDKDINIIRLKNRISSEVISNNQPYILQSSIFLISASNQIFSQILKISSQIKAIDCLGAYVDSQWIKPLNCKVFSKLSTGVYNPVFFLFFINFTKVIEIVGTQRKE